MRTGVEQKLFSYGEVGAILALSRRSVSRMVAEGLLVVHGSGRGRRVTRASLEAYLDALAGRECRGQ